MCILRGKKWSFCLLQDVADCYEKLGEPEKMLRICGMLSCSKHLISDDDKLQHFQKMKGLVESIGQFLLLTCF